MQGLTPHETDLAAISPARRAELITALADLEVFYETHPKAPVPDHPVLSVRVTGDDRQEKTEAVLAVARALGVQAEWQDGCLIAARQFGPLTLEAHYTPSQTITRAAA
ncbi:MAG TPA: hypothetical protein VHZ03_14180 [Trebonia sp.]|jgi:hypothetical protein|nr:hypothetical protein [Trebonia sp.]